MYGVVCLPSIPPYRLLDPPTSLLYTYTDREITYYKTLGIFFKVLQQSLLQLFYFFIPIQIQIYLNAYKAFFHLKHYISETFLYKVRSLLLGAMQFSKHSICGSSNLNIFQELMVHCNFFFLPKCIYFHRH